MTSNEIKITYVDKFFEIRTQRLFGTVRYGVDELIITRRISELYNQVIKSLANDGITDDPYFTFDGNKIGWLQLCHRLDCIRKDVPDAITLDF